MPVQITDLITPTAPEDTYATHDSVYGKGGYREVATLVARDAITAQRRTEGMLVHVVEDGIIYQLAANLTSWVAAFIRDHGDLTGLAADSHTQYALADGSRGDFEVTGAVATHAGLQDPHAGYTISSGATRADIALGAVPNTGEVLTWDGAKLVLQAGGGGTLAAWQVLTTAHNAVNNERLMCNTTAGAFTVTLPATPTAGDRVVFGDYANTFATNNLTVARNGVPIENVAEDLILDVRGTYTLEYVDATKGWALV